MNQYHKCLLLCVVSVLTLIETHAQSQREIDNLYTFARLYGYVRYFHPSDEAAAIDWERFAIYGAQKVQNSKSAEELQQNLQALFGPIAPTVQLGGPGEKISFDKSSVMVATPGAPYKTIAWQHRGVGLDNNQGGVYRSARTFRPTIRKGGGPEFASLSTFLDAEPLRNKEFVFRGRVKMQGDDGSGHLWVRVDNVKNMGFFDNMDGRPILQGEWATYEVKGRVDGEAAKLHLGVFLKGRGALGFDDISLQVKEDGEWKEVYKNAFTGETQGKAPKGLVPSHGAQSSYDMNVEKDKGGQAYAVIKSREGKEIIWHTTLFDTYPTVGEYIEKEIGSGLKAIIPLALYGTEEQTLPAGDKAKLEGLKEALQAVRLPEQKGDNLYTRLGDLVIAWNVFQHFYPYFDVAQTNWDGDLRAALTSAYTDKTEADFKKTLQRMTARLKDGHVRVALNTQALYLPPMAWEWVENELVITHVGDSSLPLAVGDIVKKIDGRDAKEYFREVYGRISAATDGWLHYRAQLEALFGEKDSRLNFTVVKADHSSEEVSVLRNSRTTLPPLKDSLRSLGNGVYYVNLDNTPMNLIEKAMPELQKSRVIICDLRGYPKNNHQLIQHLLSEKDTSTRWMQVPQVIYPDRETIVGYQNHGWSMKPEKPHLSAKVIFLVDGRAISYAESYMGFIEHYKLATIVGQPTAGTNGNVNPFTLPGGYYISWTGMKVQKHDGSQHHGVGIRPHVYVERTIKGVREGRDEFLEKALEIAGKPM